MVGKTSYRNFSFSYSWFKSIILFLKIDEFGFSIPLVNKALIIQVIVLTAFIMMFGLMFNKTDKTVSKKGDNDSNLKIDIDVPI